MFTTLNKDNLELAIDFYDLVKDDYFFTHFQHTHPSEMLKGWDVYLFITDRIASWGQVQKFGGNKSHTARLGFCVHPIYRQNGYGGEILNYTLSKCSRYEKLTASTRSDNTLMLNMFLKNNFIVEGCFVNEEKQDNKSINILSLARYQ